MPAGSSAWSRRRTGMRREPAGGCRLTQQPALGQGAQSGYYWSKLMNLVGKLVGIAALSGVVFSTSLLTRDRANPSWSGVGKQATTDVVARTRPASQVRALGSGQRFCSPQVLSPECEPPDSRVLGSEGVAGEGPAGPPHALAKAEAANVHSGKVGLASAALKDPESTGSVPSPVPTAKGAHPRSLASTVVQHPRRSRAASPDLLPASKSRRMAQPVQGPRRIARLRPKSTKPDAIRVLHASAHSGQCGRRRCAASTPKAVSQAPALPIIAHHQEPIQFRLAGR